MIHDCTIALRCSQALGRHAAVSVGNNAISCHSGGHETIRTEINWAEIHSGNVPVTGSGCIWLDAHTTRLVSVTDQWKGSWVMLSFLEVICVRRDKDACQSQKKELEIKMNMLRVWISCFVLTYKSSSLFIYLLFQPAVLDNLLTSMKFVLHGMGVLRINLANSKNKVCAQLFPLYCGRIFLCVCICMYVFPFRCQFPS